MEKVSHVEWTDTAKQSLKEVFDFHSQISPTYAEKLALKIIDKVDAMVFINQYQKDSINPKYRRITKYFI